MERRDVMRMLGSQLDAIESRLRTQSETGSHDLRTFAATTRDATEGLRAPSPLLVAGASQSSRRQALQ